MIRWTHFEMCGLPLGESEARGWHAIRPAVVGAVAGHRLAQLGPVARAHDDVAPEFPARSRTNQLSIERVREETFARNRARAAEARESFPE